MAEERAFWLAWSQLPGIGPILLKRVWQYFGSLAIAWDASVLELQAVEGIGPQLAETIARERANLNPLELFEQHGQTNPHFWTPTDADYPRLLLEIPDPPPVLYYRGQVEQAENLGTRSMVAIVGTRDPSDYGRRWTRRISATLAQRGFTVVSGLAEGIDTEAHRSCLAVNGRTIAVLGTGVDQIYPWSNRHLYEQLLQTGLALSEYPAGTQPDRTHFPRRNRVVAGLCRAVLVMEAPKKSGALITAHLANDYGREVYVLPGSLDNSRSLGCLGLLYKGAQVILGERHLLELLDMMPQLNLFDLPEMAAAPAPDLPPELAQVFQAVVGASQPTTEAVVFDAIVHNTGFPAAMVSSALLQLELMGLVAQLPGMRYQAR